MKYLVALILLLTSGPAFAQPCIDARDRTRVRELTLESIDNAFRYHVEHLFAIWLKDANEQPRRARIGMANGISAWQRARADAQLWEPKICKE